MATINQDPAGQASITLSGISFNAITATATPVHTGSRITVEGGSFAVNFGASTIINIETPLTAGAIALLDTPGDNAVSTVAASPAQISATRTDRLVAVSSPVQNALMAGSSDGQAFVVSVVGSIGVGVVPEPPAPTNPIPALSPVLWYDFDDAATVTLSGTTITQIDDKGIRGWDLTKSTTGPVQATWTNNNRKCVDWGSSAHSNYLRNTDTTATDIAEIYMVLDSDFGSTFPDYNGIITSPTDAAPSMFVAGFAGTTGFYPSAFDAAYLNGSTSNTYSSGILPTLNSPTLLRIKKLNDSAVDARLGIQLGRDRNYNRPFFGLIAEVVCFSSVLDSVDRAAIESWLADKWGLTLV